MAPDTSKSLGQTVGNYDLVEKVAEGGMGSVYRAKHRSTGQVDKAVEPYRQALPIFEKLGRENPSVTDYQKAAKLQPHSATAQELVATAATNAGNGAAALAALKQVLKIDPHTPQRPSIEKQIKQLQKQLAPPKKSGK